MILRILKATDYVVLVPIAGFIAWLVCRAYC